MRARLSVAVDWACMFCSLVLVWMALLDRIFGPF